MASNSTPPTSDEGGGGGDTTDDERFMVACTYWFEGVLVPILGSVGIVGNVLSIMVLTLRNLDLKSSFINLICSLCVFDILFIVSVCMFFTLQIHSDYYRDELIPYLTPVLLPLIHIALTGSVYAVVAVAVERYFIICNPFNSSSQGKGIVYIVVLVVFSVAYNINKFFEVGIGYQEKQVAVWNETANETSMVNASKAVVRIMPLRNDPTYTKAVILLNFLFMVVAPLIILSVCHFLTFRKILEHTRLHNAISSHERRDNAMATLFFIIIAFFLLCHSGKFALNFYEIFTLFASNDAAEDADDGGDEDGEGDRWPLWTFLLTKINHLTLVINSSVNFFIYCFRDAKFYNALQSILGIKNCSPALNCLRSSSGGGSGESGDSGETVPMVHSVTARRSNDVSVSIRKSDEATTDKNGNGTINQV